MLMQPIVPTALGAQRRRLREASRVFRLLPLMVFLAALIVLASAGAPVGRSYIDFLHVLVQAAAVSLASCFVSVAAYGFYRYLLDRSTGL